MIESAKAALLSCLSSVRFLRVIDVQLYLDRVGFRGRCEEAAEMLMKRVMANAW